MRHPDTDDVTPVMLEWRYGAWQIVGSPPPGRRATSPRGAGSTPLARRLSELARDGSSVGGRPVSIVLPRLVRERLDEATALHAAGLEHAAAAQRGAAARLLRSKRMCAEDIAVCLGLPTHEIEQHLHLR